MSRRAKIMATIGPASRDPDLLRSLLLAGVDVVRLNLSHGDHAQHQETIRRVREVAAALGRHVPIAVDLMGPRYRLGLLAEPRLLGVGERLLLTEDSGGDLPLGGSGLVQFLDLGERVLIDNGAVELVIEERRVGAVQARVVRGGTVDSRKGINLPESKLPFEISPKDLSDIKFAVELEVDFIGASYVGRAEDLAELREAIAAVGGDVPLIAKIERAAALDHIEEIVASANAVMVARGDLGVEVQLELLPLVQKRIAAAGRATATPVIVATEMLASMITQPRPTRAEVSDVANAVFDGVDVVMLSGETAIGQFPLEAVQMMARIVQRAETHQAGPARAVSGLTSAAPQGIDAGRRGAADVPDVVAAAAARTAELLAVRRIVAFTKTGSTARLMARYRPAIGVVAFTPHERVARRLQLVWGVEPQVIPGPKEHDEVVELVERELLRIGQVQPGEVIIVLMGAPISKGARTNLMQIHRVGGAS